MSHASSNDLLQIKYKYIFWLSRPYIYRKAKWILINSDLWDFLSIVFLGVFRLNMIKLQPLIEYNNQINEPMHIIVILKNSKKSHQPL
jgi:hypothetical protein